MHQIFLRHGEHAEQRLHCRAVLLPINRLQPRADHTLLAPALPFRAFLLSQQKLDGKGNKAEFKKLPDGAVRFFDLRFRAPHLLVRVDHQPQRELVAYGREDGAKANSKRKENT